MAEFKVVKNDGTILDGKAYARKRTLFLPRGAELIDADVLDMLRQMKRNGEIKDYEVIGRVEPSVCIIHDEDGNIVQ
jgi:hypothetical protein